MQKLKSLERLEDSLVKLPSVGRKSAERMSYAILNMEDKDIEEFALAIKDLKKNLTHCPKCGMMIEGKECPICDNPNRDKSLVMVVSDPKDVVSLEKSEGYNGVYHVLNGEISLTKGKTVSDLNINPLLAKVDANEVREVIIATNPTLDGETTALYLSKLLTPKGVTVTRLAYGLQMGGNIDYTDQLTLLKALQGRQKI